VSGKSGVVGTDEVRGALVRGALVGGALVRGAVVGGALVTGALVRGAGALVAGALVGGRVVTVGRGCVSGGGGSVPARAGVAPLLSLMDTIEHWIFASGAPDAGALTVAVPV
jgi:hypothetical protein